MILAVFENLVVAAYAVLTLIVGLAAWRAWWFARSPKVLLLAFGFSLLFLKAVFLAIGLFWVPDWESLFVPSLVLDLVVIALFYLAVLHRSR